VLDSCRALEAEGFKVTYLPVETNGLIDINLLAETIQPETSLVSIMAVNNEIGVKQPIAEIGKYLYLTQRVRTCVLKRTS